jgi:hypothetical protein
MNVFLSDPVSLDLFNLYSRIWNLYPIDEPVITELPVLSQTLYRFFSQIRLRAGEKIQLQELCDLCFCDLDTLLKMFLLVQLNQGHESIKIDAANTHMIYSQSY